MVMPPRRSTYPTMLSITSLPVELLEYILVTCGCLGEPSSIANLSRTCRFFRDTVYHTSDSHLWREIYLSTFDDPRPVLRTIRQLEDSDDDITFDWKKAYQDRIHARRLFRRKGKMNLGLEPVYLKQSIDALLSDIATASLHPSTFGEFSIDPPAVIAKRRNTCIPSHLKTDSDSSNISWVSNLVVDGFPEALVHRLIGRSPTEKDSNSYIPLYEKIILDENWEYTEAGRTFYRLLLQTGFQPMVTSADNAEDPGSPYNLRSSSKKKVREEPLSETAQRSFARTIARNRVYNLRYLSERKCWGPYLSLTTPRQRANTASYQNDSDPGSPNENNIPETGDISLPFIHAVLSDFNIVLENHSLFEEMLDPVEGDDGDFVPSQNGAEDDSGEESDSEFVVKTQEHEAEHSDGDFDSNEEEEEEEEEGMSSPILATFHVDPGEPNGSTATPLPVPVFPSQPHLLKPDYVFLSAARMVVEENLRDRYGHKVDSQEGLWPWFTSIEALDSTRVILERARSLDGLRMGGAPGFWTGDGVASERGWFRKEFKDEEDGTRPKAKAKAKAKSESATTTTVDGDEECEGWDWAGAQGKWMRAVAWMDYRDLLFHNVRALRTPNPLTTGSRSNESDIRETIRVFPMNIKVTGYSRVPPPRSLSEPGPSTPTSTPVSASRTSSRSSKDPKGKGKAREEDLVDDSSDVPSSNDHYDPLVYTLPIIHIFGEYRGSDVDENARRVCRGTVRMIGDRAVRWTLVSLKQ
ncbi:hypothetical protein E1B28_003397 [Marasmius oreades]|uniref:F-box domain-containing protein n=1 Tax=Marasmius oreades TaxID=181124 RepID=A0A9P7UND4_9AGAR|nr:uncharacterized protein E1B28_003397 [Marasmius oreades]KAG7085864.1 hypothetical protein E1B28_003397 [Marasmius oreades]